MNPHLEEARRSYRALEKSVKPEATALFVKAIDMHLRKAKCGYDALDPTGKSSAARMRKNIDGFVKARYIDKARGYLRALSHGSDESDIFAPEFWLKAMEAELQKANADYAALDPKGEKTHKKMLPVIAKAERAAHLRQARKKFVELKEGLSLETALAVRTVGKKHNPESVAEAIREHLELAGRDLAALDPEGKKSTKDMEAELDAARKNKKYKVRNREKLRQLVDTMQPKQHTKDK